MRSETILVRRLAARPAASANALPGACVPGLGDVQNPPDNARVMNGPRTSPHAPRRAQPPTTGPGSEMKLSETVDVAADLDGDELLSDSRSALLVELFAELAEPLLVVNSDRKVVFRSRAFQTLIGSGHCQASDHCEAMLLPTPTKEGPCCWSSVDAYLPGRTTGLWHLKQSADAPLPVLAELRPISFGTRRSLLALRFSPLPRLPSPVALSFFTGLRRSSGDEHAYLLAATSYLRRMCGVGAAAWFDCASGAASRLVRQEGLNASEAENLRTSLVSAGTFGTQDVLVCLRGRTEVFHVFTCGRRDRLMRLAVGRLSGQLDLQSVEAARAAVCAAHEDSTAPETAPGIHDQVVLDTLSATEHEILQQICRGLADKEIARARGVSVYTVKNQVKRILEKAGVHRRTELITRFAPHR